MRSNIEVLDLSQQSTSPTMKAVLTKLKNAELQAIELVRLFKEKGYVSTTSLLEILQQQKIPKVELPLVIAYLAGYISGEVYESPFKQAIFGENSMGTGREEEIIAKSGAVALISLMDETEMVTLPNRVTRKRAKNRPKNQ